ncbi:response regulator [Pseudomarimonas arenosa]|uniref:Response regulator n=1 Tax=Pseudomarimonas arenosa TaxID=2774145 RepID=A0AAW3ZSN9_9GAMM|nr:response regulator [Pseudomarimonas arenosa]MBD8527201.1 response regulator [Pseudomarimonas arenosa]
MKKRRADSYSTLEVARLLSVTVQTVQRWVDAGHLQAWRTVGGHRRIDANSLQQFRQASGELALSHPELSHKVTAEEVLEPVAEPRVVVADDDEADRELIGYLLHRLRPNWQVEFAENGFAALLAIGRHRPDVLITDIVMPYLNGPAMLRTLMADPEHSSMAILAVSSHSAEEIRELGGLPAGVAFIGKPLSREALNEFLNKAISRATSTEAAV